MADAGATLLARLAGIVGGAHVLSAPADVEPFLADWRGRFRGAARAVVKPGTTEEVAALVRACAETGTAVVPQGGNTGLCGGAVPDASGEEILVSLVRMNRVRALDAANATITVEAGMPLAAVQSAAAAAGLHFPLSLASEGSCTIGGNLSTNAGGTAVLRYGNTRDLTLGVEAVLADGSIYSALRGLRKDNTGYDLKQLFIGAEGTLGIVTAAVLKLFPAPRTRVTAFAAVGSVDAAIDLLAPFAGHARGPADRIRVDERNLARPVAQASSGRTRSAARASVVRAGPGRRQRGGFAAAGAGRDGARGGGRSRRRRGRGGRAVRRAGGAAVDAAREHQRSAAARGPQHQARYFASGIGDPAVHARMRDRARARRFQARASSCSVTWAMAIFITTCRRRRRSTRAISWTTPGARTGSSMTWSRGTAGSFSAEHGVGQLKRDDLVRYKSPVELRLMRAVKHALDPLGLMNPGKVL